MSDRTDERVTALEEAIESGWSAWRDTAESVKHRESMRLEWQAYTVALASLAADAAETQTLRDLLGEAECVIFEGVRQDAPHVTGCDSWDEVVEDADEVRWHILEALGLNPVNYERFTRIGAKEKAETERDAAVADRDRLAEALREISAYGCEYPRIDLLSGDVHCYGCSACIALKALAGREGSDDA